MNDGGAAESEEEVNVSIVSGRGRQAYPAGRRAASDEKKEWIEGYRRAPSNGARKK
jgi:hypothetical protein